VGDARAGRPIAGLLLAAGGGTRYEGPTHKLLADVRGRPLVAVALDNAMAAGFDALAVVTGAVDLAALVPDGCTLLHNPAWRDGQATSLAVGVAWAADSGFDAVVTGLADQPGIHPDSWRAVAAATATPIAVATYGGRRGHPVRLGRQVWDLLPTTGDAGARVIMASSPELVTEVPCAGDPSDVDTVDDLMQWR
jgi:molybdenum cofactor cytidylyltransferase